MKGKTANYLYSALVFSVLYTVANVSLAQNFDQAQALCSDLTPAKKAMAESAGYDVDQLCSQVSSTSRKTQVTAPLPTIPRATVSTSTASEQFSFDQQVVNDERLPQFEADNGADENIEPLTEAEIEKSLLKPYGYDLFANAPSTFAPTASLSVSSDYLLGPGDSLDILFYGKTNNSFSLEINREGIVDFPELGPVALAGLSYAEAKAMLKSRIAEQIVGAQVSISMGTLRSMQIFVLGEAFKPGAYTVSSLATVTQALISSGGVSDIGSLRNIQIKRQGMVVATLDLYDLLMRGDTANDLRLRDSDVIYIPTVGDQVSIMGEVLRPAIYELKGSETAGDLIALAGGLVAKAYAKSVRLERVNATGFMTVVDLDLNSDAGKSFNLAVGDHLTVAPISDYMENIISLNGAVRYPGDFSWREGMRISDVLPTLETLQIEADASVALLFRERANSADIDAFIFSPQEIFAELDSDSNITLQSRDRIEIFSSYDDRQEQLTPYIEKFKRQSRLDSLTNLVSSGGEVRFPGEYPLVAQMTVQDLISLSGGLKESAYSQTAEIARIDLSNPDSAVNTIEIARLDASSSLELTALDYVEFRTIPNFQERQSITLEGEFVFPGVYDFEKGESLTSVIARAGGFTSEAFVDGSVFTRESLKKRERQEVARLNKLLKEQLELERLKQSNADVDEQTVDLSAQEEALESLADLDVVGRLVIPLAEIMVGANEDIVLQKDDRLIVPKMSQEVTIIGEVQRPTSYLFDQGLTPKDYVVKSGGLKPSADEDGIYVVKASGEVLAPQQRLFRFKAVNSGIQPGDTIVVPVDTEDKDVRVIDLLSQVSQIIYQLSLGAAAVNTFNNTSTN
ncbi:SLBB domain-containing protein [Porticoccaceae bacterium]|nr:SLBB domain-containing protein [Porticoccaceae bacterium]